MKLEPAVGQVCPRNDEVSRALSRSVYTVRTGDNSRQEDVEERVREADEGP